MTNMATEVKAGLVVRSTAVRLRQIHMRSSNECPHSRRAMSPELGYQEDIGLYNPVFAFDSVV